MTRLTRQDLNFVRANPHSGFTLIELMVTIAVVAIIAMIAAPSFTQTIRKNQLNSETRDFVNLLVETRSEAILKQRNTTLTLNGSGGFKNWQNSNLVLRDTGATSVVFNRLGQTTLTNHQCFVFKHNKEVTLKSYVYVQKDGVVFYDKTLTACPT